jgi:hypothetical protein
MIEFSFEVPRKENVRLYVKKAFEQKGGSFQGDERHGRYACGGFRGTYRVSGGRVTLRITQKPFLIPDFLIKSRIRKFFEAG